MKRDSATRDKHADSGLRNAVFKSLSHKCVSAAASKLSSIVNNDQISPVLITRLAVTTPEFEANIRSGICSGTYCPEPIDIADLRQAFAMFDQATTWEIVVAAGLETVVRPLLETTELNVREFMRHALATSAGCGVVAESLNLPRSMFVAAGLFHNIGLAVMAHAHPEKYQSAQVALQGSNTTLEDWEYGEFGFTHEDAGAMFLAAMTMPDAVWSSAGTHHSPEPTSDLLVASVRVCANVAHQVGCTVGFANACGPIHPSLIPDIGLSEADLGRMAERMGQSALTASNIAA